MAVIFSTNDSLWEKYKKLGPKIIDAMEGEFSFALYDQNKDTYFAARDPLGIKALYYTRIKDQYHFSTEIGDLLALASVERRPNLKSMRTMLECQAVDHHETMYEGIDRLPPGYILTIEGGREQIERYWYPEKIATNYSIGEEEAAEKLKILFEKAVMKRIGDLKETAFELSGGLDSTSVVSLLAQSKDPASLSTYSLTFEGIDCDESEYVDATLKKYPLDHSKVPAADLDYKEEYSLKNLYTLSPHWPITITFAMSIPMVETMVEEGKKVILTGQGGDHLFTGTAYAMSDLFRRGKFLSLRRELKQYRYPYKVLRDYALRPLLSSKLIELLKRLLGKKAVEPACEQKCSQMEADFVYAIKNKVRRFDLSAITSALYTTLMDGNLFHAMEKAFGVEYRHPFFDRELVEFALSLPPEMKYRKRAIKWIWRKAMKGVLPEKIMERKDKAEFSEVLMRQIDALDLEELLGDPCIVRLGLIDREVLDCYIASYRERSKQYTVPLWSAVNVEYWYRYNGFGCR